MSKVFQMSGCYLFATVFLLASCGEDSKKSKDASPPVAPQNVTDSEGNPETTPTGSDQNSSTTPEPSPDAEQPKPFPTPDLTQINPANLNLVVVGDSISAGVFADTNKGDVIGNSEHSLLVGLNKLIPDITTFILQPETPAIADIQRFLTHPELSAFSPTAGWAIPARLQSATDFPGVDVVNLAVAGASATKFAEEPFLQGKGQIDWLADRYADGSLTKKAEVVIYQLGANDFCRDISIDDFQVAATEQIAKLVDLHPSSQIMILPIPDIPTITSEVNGAELAISVERQAVIDRWQLSGPITLVIPELSRTCQEIKDLFEFCQGPDNSDRLESMNQILQDIVSTHQANNKPVGFGAGLNTAEFYADPAALVAGDCYHPSAAGHQRIADYLWPDLANQLGVAAQ